MPWHDGDLVHKLRRISGLNVEELARVAELPPSVIRRLEQGITKEATPSTIRKLATVFGFTHGEFVDAIPQATLKVPDITLRMGEETMPTKDRRQVAKKKSA